MVSLPSRPFTVAVDGAELSGEAHGENPELVLAHGMGGSRATWDRVVAALPANLPLVRYDLRGFGASQQDDGIAFSHTDDLVRLLDALEIERASVCGLSLGGAVTANLAINHPDRVHRAILVSPALAGWEWSDEWRALWLAVCRAARAGDMAAARELWFAHPMFATTRASEAAGELRASIAAFAGRQWVKDWQRPVLPDIDRLHELAAPTLLLTGERDLPDFRLIADLIAAAVPDIRRVDYPGAGHMLPLERAGEVAAEIAAFVAG